MSLNCRVSAFGGTSLGEIKLHFMRYRSLVFTPSLFLSVVESSSRQDSTVEFPSSSENSFSAARIEVVPGKVLQCFTMLLVVVDDAAPGAWPRTRTRCPVTMVRGSVARSAATCVETTKAFFFGHGPVSFWQVPVLRTHRTAQGLRRRRASLPPS